MLQPCKKCKGDGFVMIDETPEECANCEGEGLCEESLFDTLADIARVHNKILLEIYSPFQF